MTPEELRSHFNRVFGMENTWPKTYEVDAETYGYCCQVVFEHAVNNDHIALEDNTRKVIYLNLGPNKGLMFKNVELILKS